MIVAGGRILPAAVAALMIAAFGSAAEAQQMDTVRYAQFAGVPLPTITVAQEKGFFKKHNLNVTVTNVQSPPEAISALAAGQVDLAHTSAIASMLGTLKGGKVMLLAGMEASFTDKSGHPWEAVFLIARGGEGIKKIGDLKGKKLGVPGFGSLYDYLLRAQYMEMGIDPAKDVTFIPVPYPQAAGALMQKEVDAAVVSMDGYALAQTRGPVEIIAGHTGMEGSRVGYTAALAGSDAFVNSKPEVTARFLRALLEARIWMEAALASKDPEFPDLMQKSLRLAADKVEFYMTTRAGYYGKDKEFINPLDLPKDLMVRYVNVLKAVAVLNKDVDGSYDKIVNIEPLKKAYAAAGVTWDETKH